MDSGTSGFIKETVPGINIHKELVLICANFRRTGSAGPGCTSKDKSLKDNDEGKYRVYSL